MADEKEGAAVPRTAEAQPDELTDPTPFLDRLKGKPSRDSRIDAAAFLGERPTPTQHDLAHLLDMVKETRRERAQTREPQVAGASPAGSFGSRERGESSGGAGPITEAAARMAVRLARFEAFSEALEVLSSADCVNDAIARVAELRSAAKPAVPRPSKATPVCDDCSHPMAHWRDDLWQCAMTTCKSSGKVIHIPGLRTEGVKATSSMIQNVSSEVKADDIHRDLKPENLTAEGAAEETVRLAREMAASREYVRGWDEAAARIAALALPPRAEPNACADCGGRPCSCTFP
jgi:hypothetical protein